MTVHERIAEIRKNQDTQHGGPDHDDTHSWGDWIKFIEKQLDKSTALVQAVGRVGVKDQPENFLSPILHAGALALAALESMARKRGNGEIPPYEKLPDALYVPASDVANTYGPYDWLHKLYEHQEEAAEYADAMIKDPMASFGYRSAMVHIHGLAVACGEAIAFDANKGRQPIPVPPSIQRHKPTT